MLRRAELGDVEARLALGNDAAIVAMFGGSRADAAPVTREDAAKAIAAMMDNPFAWVIDAGGYIGSARLHGVDRRDRRASFAIGILDPSRLGQGLGTEATRLVLEYAFRQLGLHRISVRVLAHNERAVRCYAKCGFVVEGREREAASVDGAWHDDLIMGVLDREFLAVEARNSKSVP